MAGQAEILFKSIIFSGQEKKQIHQNFVKLNLILTQKTTETANNYSPPIFQQAKGDTPVMHTSPVIYQNEYRCSSAGDLKSKTGENIIQYNDKYNEQDLLYNCVILPINQHNDT